MRITDGFLSLPAPVLAIAVVAALGPGFVHTLIAVSIVWWPFYARLVRGEVARLAARPHIEAARLAGVGPIRLATRHLLPGAVPNSLVAASLDIGTLILALTAVLFVLQHISPMDPVKAQLGANASAEAVAARRHTLGLDQPMINQFWNYLTGAVHGDLGTSFRTRHAVSSDLSDFVPATLELALYGMGLALILAGLLAFGTTLKWPGASVLRAVLFTGASAPMFLLGILGLIVFYQKLGWVPANGRISVPNPPTGPTGLLTVDGLLAGRFDVVADALHHLILPL
jgi:ABC-type dipeptide/oligopeptide/nickel transport system permease component